MKASSESGCLVISIPTSIYIYIDLLSKYDNTVDGRNPVPVDR